MATINVNQPARDTDGGSGSVALLLVVVVLLAIIAAGGYYFYYYGSSGRTLAPAHAVTGVVQSTTGNGPTTTKSLSVHTH